MTSPTFGDKTKVDRRILVKERVSRLDFMFGKQLHEIELDACLKIKATKQVEREMPDRVKNIYLE